jgi:hypothetical protein
VVRLAVTLRRGVTIVQVRKERPVRRAKILAITAQGVQVQVVLKTYQVGLPIHGVDSGAGESPVEAVNRAGGQKLRTCDPIWRNYGQAAVRNGLYLRTSEGMCSHLQSDVVKLRIRQREAGYPDATVGAGHAASVRPELVRSRVWDCGTRYARGATTSSHCVLSAPERTWRKNNVASEGRCTNSPRIRSVRC